MGERNPGFRAIRDEKSVTGEGAKQKSNWGKKKKTRYRKRQKNVYVEVMGFFLSNWGPKPKTPQEREKKRLGVAFARCPWRAGLKKRKSRKAAGCGRQPIRETKIRETRLSSKQKKTVATVYFPIQEEQRKKKPSKGKVLSNRHGKFRRGGGDHKSHQKKKKKRSREVNKKEGMGVKRGVV